MSDSPTVSSLHQLLAGSTPGSTAPPGSSNSSSPASSPRRRSPSPATASARSTSTQTVRALPARAGWGSTISSAFGYRTASSPPPTTGSGGAETYGAATVTGGAQRVRGRERARLPVWGVEEEATLGEDKEDGRELEAHAEQGDHNDHEMDALVQCILWQAGNDHLDPPGPLLVIAASRIPSPSEVPHPHLLAKLRLRLEELAQAGPYTVVLLVNPTPHAPTTAHLVSSYLSLSRTARKNLRRICVVGGGWWTRVIIGIFSSTLLSAKSARKLVQCATLSALAEKVGAKAFTQVDLPLEVYAANAVIEKAITLPDVGDKPPETTFGVPLEQLMGANGVRLPPVVRDCVEVIFSQGPESVGVFRRSPSAAHVAHLRSAYGRGHPVALAALPDAPYLAASLLKLFLRELPTPVLPRGEVWDVARACPLDDDRAAVQHVRGALLPLLGAPARALLQHVLAVASAVAARAEVNLMTAGNLVVCLCPALCGALGDVPTMEELEMCRVPGLETLGTIKGLGGETARAVGGNTLGGVLRVMIERYDELFPPSSDPSLSLDRQRQRPPSPAETTPCDTAVAISPVSLRHTTAPPSTGSSPEGALSTSPASLASTSSAAPHRSRNSTFKLNKSPRAGAGGRGGAGFLIEAFREEGAEGDRDGDVQRVEAHGELVSPRASVDGATRAHPQSL